MGRVVVVFALAACGGEEPPSGLAASLFALDPAVVLQHAPLDDPENGATRWLVPEGETWEIREGTDWDDGVTLEVLDVSLAGDLTVEGEIVLPASVSVNASAGDATVTAVEPFDGWYGTFDPATVVEVAAGRTAGTWAFAEVLGPVRYSLDGQSWELVYYERRAP